MRSVGMRKIKEAKLGGQPPLQEIGRPRTTSSFVQVWTLPQCAQVNFCAFTLAVGQSFSFTVRPVSVNFDVEGQRTSKLLRPVPTFGFGRRGGSKRNRVAIIKLKSINDPRLGGIVGRHLHLYTISNR